MVYKKFANVFKARFFGTPGIYRVHISIGNFYINVDKLLL